MSDLQTLPNGGTYKNWSIDKDGNEKCDLLTFPNGNTYKNWSTDKDDNQKCDLRTLPDGGTYKNWSSDKYDNQKYDLRTLPNGGTRENWSSYKDKISESESHILSFKKCTLNSNFGIKVLDENYIYFYEYEVIHICNLKDCNLDLNKLNDDTVEEFLDIILDKWLELSPKNLRKMLQNTNSELRKQYNWELDSKFSVLISENKLKKLKTKKTTDKTTDKCVICLNKYADYVIIHNDTGHKCICSDCKEFIKKCPLCRNVISLCCKTNDPYITTNNIKVY